MALPFNDLWRPVNGRVPRDRVGSWVQGNRRHRYRVRKTNPALLWDPLKLDQIVPLSGSRHLQLDWDVQQSVKAWVARLEPPLDRPVTDPPTEADRLYAFLREKRLGTQAPGRRQTLDRVGDPWLDLDGDPLPPPSSWMNQLSFGAISTHAWIAARGRLREWVKHHLLRRPQPTSLELAGWTHAVLLPGPSPATAWPEDTAVQLLARLRDTWWPRGPPDFEALALWAALQDALLQSRSMVVALAMQRLIDAHWCWTALPNQTAHSRQQYKAAEAQLLHRFVVTAWDTNHVCGTILSVLPVHSDRWIELATLPNASQTPHHRLWSLAMTKVLSQAGCRAWHDPTGRAVFHSDRPRGDLAWIDDTRTSTVFLKTLADYASQADETKLRNLFQRLPTATVALN